MNHVQTNKPMVLNMDKGREHLSETEAFYLLNHQRYVNINGRTKGAVLGKTTPVGGNEEACSIDQPQGENYCVGAYRSPITNEVYSFHYNSNNVHYILRITNAGCQIVYFGCLDLSVDPRHAIKQWRVYLKVDRTCKNQHGKQLIWTIGRGAIGQLDVEASIATSYFTTPFFGDMDNLCYDPCELVQMCVPKICGSITAEYVPYNPTDAGKTNNLLDIGFKFMVRHIYYDGRASEWSDVSSLYLLDTKGCFDTSVGLSRCLKLRIPFGNPLVEKIELAYSKDNGATWFSYDVIEKYQSYNSAQQKWYERSLSEIVSGSGYSEVDCKFDYYFCNDKQCDAIDPNDASRVYNPIPRDAQGLIPIKEALGFYNYIGGTCPIESSEVKKGKLTIDCGTDPNCPVEMVTVTVRAVIHNTYKNKNQAIFRMEDDEDPLVGKAMFGGLNDWDKYGQQLSGGFENPIAYDQYFNGKTRNFNVYIEGTDIWAEMKQFQSAAWWHEWSRKEYGIVSGWANDDTKYWVDRWTDDGNFYYQEAKLKVKKGTKGFLRLTSHFAQNGLGDNQDTSTFVFGTINLGGYKGDLEIGSVNGKHEIYFNTCNGDVDLGEAFIIRDNAQDGGLTTKASAANGYIKDSLGNPVEGAVITVDRPLLGEFPAAITDHNGFYHFSIMAGFTDVRTVKVLVEKDCTVGNILTSFKTAKEFSISFVDGMNVESDQVIRDQDFVDYKSKFYALGKVRVVDCNGNGVAGLRIAMSGSKYEVTGADGVATFRRLRNYYSRARQFKAVVMDYRDCLTFDCNDVCNPCLPEASLVGPSCFYVNDATPFVNLTFPTMVVNREAAFTDRRGLKNGGRYGFAIMVEGRCGRISSPYPLGKNDGYIDIPRAQEVGDVNYCAFKYDLTGFVAPEWGSCLKILRTKNLNPFELQWSVDKIERIGNNRIKLTIQSLNDYNASYNFKTNTVYQYLKGDRIEFIKNGDGKIFKTTQHGVLNYLTLSPSHDRIISGQENPPADFFNQLLIEDDGRLDSLTEGAVIEMQRPTDCTIAPTYYEMGVSIPIVDGKVEYETGIFKTFDTHLVSRQTGSISQSYEHHSPNDFVDFRYDDLGKGHVVNKYENEKRFGRRMSINAPEQYNYFGHLVKTFDAPEQGDIIAMGISDGKVILAIGEHDNFLAQVADDLLRVGQDGTIRALPPDSIVSNAEPKLSGKYGCQYPHIGSIFFGDAYATWISVNAHQMIMHNYSEAIPVSKGKLHSYISRRCQEMEAHNRKTAELLDHYRFSSGINLFDGVVYTTIKTLRQGGINNEKAPYLKPNETFAFDPSDQEFLTFKSFTPEEYTHIDLFDGNGCAFITFLNGIPYIHPIIPKKWNEFYGVAVDRVVGIALNKYPEKIKNALSCEVKDEKMWFLHSVTTDNANFISEVPPIRWKRDLGKNKWNAAFLNNINSLAGLYGNSTNYAGSGTKGYVISCTFVRDNTDQLKYNSIDNKKRIEFDELDLISFKFSTSEQSGFTENL